MIGRKYFAAAKNKSGDFYFCLFAMQRLLYTWYYTCKLCCVTHSTSTVYLLLQLWLDHCCLQIQSIFDIHKPFITLCFHLMPWGSLISNFFYVKCVKVPCLKVTACPDQRFACYVLWYRNTLRVMPLVSFHQPWENIFAVIFPPSCFPGFWIYELSCFGIE